MMPGQLSLVMEGLRENLLPRLLPFIAKIWFPAEERRRFWRKLASQVRYDLSITLALEMYRENLVRHNSPLELVFDEVIRAYNDGQSLDTSFATFVPQEELMLIQAGVKSGSLPDTLELCAGLIKAKQGIMSSLVGALAYPAVLLAMLVIILCVLSFYVLPELAQLADPSSWGVPAKILFGIAAFVASPIGMIILVSAVLGLAASIISLPLWTGPVRKRVENLPPWSFYKLIHGSVWMFTVASLMRAGVSFQYILDDMLASSSLSPWLEERISAIRERFQDGGKLAATMAATGFNFPDSALVEDLQVYETLPGFHNHLFTLASEWLAQGQESIERKANALNIGLIALVIGFMCLLALGVTSLNTSLTLNMGEF